MQPTLAVANNVRVPPLERSCEVAASLEHMHGGQNTQHTLCRPPLPSREQMSSKHVGHACCACSMGFLSAAAHSATRMLDQLLPCSRSSADSKQARLCCDAQARAPLQRNLPSRTCAVPASPRLRRVTWRVTATATAPSVAAGPPSSRLTARLQKAMPRGSHHLPGDGTQPAPRGGSPQ